MARLHHRYAELEALIQPNTTTLSREDTEQLERAAFLSEVCSFAEAVAIFDGFGESTRLQQPAIAIEYALLLLRQARYATAHQHLEQALRHAEADGKLVADRPEYRILLILLARAEVWAVGSFRRAKESMDEIRVWLKDVAVEDCTNLHVRCIVEYALLGKCASHISSVYDAKFYGDILECPAPESGALKPWQFLTPLRECLQDQGRINEARAILRSECCYLFHAEAKKQAAYSFLAACSKAHPEQNQPVWLREGSVRLDLAEWLAREGSLVEAGQQIDVAKRLFEVGVQGEGHAHPRDNLLLLVDRALLVLRPADTVEKYDAWVSLADRAGLARFHWLEDISLGDAANIASALCTEPGAQQPDVDRFFAVSARQEELCRRNGDAYFLACNRCDVSAQMRRGGRFLTEILKWWDQFDWDFPDFDLWNLCHVRERDRTVACKELRDMEGAETSLLSRLAVIARECEFWEVSSASAAAVAPRRFGYPSFWFADVGGFSVDGGGEEGERIWLRPGFDPDLRMQALQEGGVYDYFDYAYMVLLEWLTEDFSKGRLPPDVLQAIFLPAGPAPPQEQSDGTPLDGIALLASLGIQTLRTKSLPARQENLKPALDADVLDMWLFLTRSYEEADRHFIAATLQMDRVTTFEARLEQLHEKQAYVEAIKRFLALYPRLHAEVKPLFGDSQAHLWSSLGSALSTMCQTSVDTLMTGESGQRLEESIRAHEQALQHHTSKSDLFQQGFQLVNIAQVRLTQRLRDPSLAFEPTLSLLRQAETCFDEIRQDYVLLGDVEGLESFSGSSSRMPFASPYRTAVMLLWTPGPLDETTSKSGWKQWVGALRHLWSAYVGGGGGGDEQPYYESDGIRKGEEIWRWIQKGKARSLSEFMGIGYRLTARMTQKLESLEEEGGEWKALLSQEQDLVAKAKTAKPVETPAIRGKIQETRARMSQIPELKLLLDVRQGAPLRLEELDDISASARRGNVVHYIDWFEQFPRKYTLTIARAGGTKPVAFRLSVPEESVRDFVKLCSDEDSCSALREDHAIEQLQKMEGLISPIVASSCPGDTLVFSPVGMLHRIPLHAIRVSYGGDGGEPLICRNPIVYCHGLSLLRQSFLARREVLDERYSQPPPPPRAPVLFGGVDSQICHDSITDVGELLSGTAAAVAYTGAGATAGAFKHSLLDSNANLFHIFAHALFIDVEPLNHAIYFMEDGSYATASEIFSLLHRRGEQSYPFHVTMICCESGVVGNTYGSDEIVLGLVPALQAAGAASTLSTLWKVDQRDGEMFSRVFYEGFTAHEAEDEEGVVDLARAYQKASVKMMHTEGKEALYHWAPFVLHGFWMFPFCS